MINLNELHFRFAFSVEAVYTEDYKMKNDPRYVKYIVSTFGKRNGIFFEKVLSFHKCNDNDYDQFFPVKK